MSFTVTGTGCSINGSNLTATSATTCIVVANKASSTGVNSTLSAAKTFVFSNAVQAATAPANQATLTISNTMLTAIPGSTITLATTGGSGTGAVSYLASGTGCSISGSSLTASASATCVVTATKAASTGFNAITSANKNFSFANANQTTLTISNTTLTAIPGSTITLATTGGSGTGVVSYSVSGTGCSINGNVLTASAVATCVVTATKDASTGFNSITSATKSFSFANANQNPLVVYPVLLGYVPGTSITLSAVGGSGTGAVTYEVTGSGCTLNGTTLTSSIETTCTAWATKAASAGFNSITSDRKGYSFRNQSQATLSISNTTLRNLPGTTLSLTTAGGSGTGAINFTVSGADCTIAGTTLVAATVTNCVVVASKAASAGFNATTSAPTTFVYALADQAPLSVANSVLSGFTGTPISLTTSGGSGTGDVTFQVSGTGCALSGNTLSATTDTTCAVTAVKAGSAGFNPVTSSIKSFTFKVPLAAPVISSTFAKRDSIQVDYVVVSGISYKLDLLDSAGTLLRTVCTACAGSNLISTLTPVTTYKLKLTATKSNETATTELSVTTYASFELQPTITRLTRSNKLYTATFNPQNGWKYRLQTVYLGCSGKSPLTTDSPIVWINPNAGNSCKVSLYAEDIYGNSGATTLPNPEIIDNAPPAASKVTVTPTSLTGSGTIIVVSRGTDDFGVLEQLVSLVNSAGVRVAGGVYSSVFQSGSDTDQVFATSFSVPAGLTPGTYSISVLTTDWTGKRTTTIIETITIS